MQYLKVINIEESKAEDVNKYLAHVAKTNVSDSFINNEVNAIKFYFEKVVFLPDFQIERIKGQEKSEIASNTEHFWRLINDEKY